jgi:NADH-quinone oxidoreductase subunit N
MIPPLSLEFSLVCLGIFLLLIESFSPREDKRFLGWIAVAFLAGLFVASFFTGPVPPVLEAFGFYTADPAGMFFKRLMIFSTALTLVAAIDYLPVYARYLPSSKPGAGTGEFLILPVFACAGLMWMTTASDFVMIFVALELVTITFYVLVAGMRRNKAALEAGVKYFILGALSTGFLVYGITWIFGMSGQTSLDGLRDIMPRLAPGGYTGLLFGLGLVMVALGFKIAAVPFQFWVPDVYQGAPTPVTAYLSVASKAAGFIVLLRVIEPFLVVPLLRDKVLLVVGVLAAATLLFGNLAAMPQTNFKRLLAYSSIAHAGYLLLGVAAVGSGQAGTAIAFYFAGYALATFVCFVVLILVARAADSDDIAAFNGLAARSPALALILSLAILSLAGIPFTAGFLGKFFVFEAAVRAGLLPLVAVGVVAVACGFYYYFKVIRAVFWQPAVSEDPVPVSPFSFLVLWLLTAGTLVFGVWPRPILDMLH